MTSPTSVVRRSPKGLLTVVIALLAVAAVPAAARAGVDTSTAAAPSIASDKPDYAPGEEVVLTGSNWRPGETVQIYVNDDQGSSWSRSVGVTAAADGTITDRFNLPDWFVAVYSVTATGEGGVAKTSFTDGNVKLRAPSGSFTIDSVELQNTTNCIGGTAKNTRSNLLVTSTADTTAGGVNGGDSLKVTIVSQPTGSVITGWTTSDGGTVSDLGDGDAATWCFPGASGATNYRAVYAAAKQSQTITFGALADKTYGDAPFAVSATASSGLAVSFATSGDCTNSGNTITITGAGSCEVTASQGGDSSYNPAPSFDQTFSIAKKSLTVTASSPTGVVYGGAKPTITPGYGTFVGTDGVADLDTKPACSTTYNQGDDAGSYATSCSGGSDNNYSYSFVGGELVVGKRSLTVTASSPTGVVYGDAKPTITAIYGAFYGGETRAVLDSEATCGTSYSSGSPVSGNPYSTACSDGSDNNYAYEFVDGSFNIAKAPLTIRASSPTGVVYGDTPTIIASYETFVTGDDDNDLTTKPACGAGSYTAGDPVGPTYTTSCSGASSGNYDITYATGSFTLAKKGLKITASSGSGTYGDAAPTITPSYAGFITVDDASDLDTQPTCSTAYDQGDPVSGSPYTTSCSGAASGNYEITYANGSFALGKKEITATASSPANIVFGDPAPTITAAYDGFVLGQDASVIDTPATCTTTYDPGDIAGEYETSCSGAADGNYSFAYVKGSLTVDYWPWDGFFRPIDNKDVDGKYILNVVKAGSTVPAKFSLGTDRGLEIFQTGYPKASGQITCDSAASQDVLEELSTATVSGLKYDALANQYIYNWKTDKAWAGQCRQLVVALKDGAVKRAAFKFTK